jgi:hypothetical protein
MGYLTMLPQLRRSKGMVTVNGELGRIWKEMVVAYFEALSNHLCGVTTETYKNSRRIEDNPNAEQ